MKNLTLAQKNRSNGISKVQVSPRRKLYLAIAAQLLAVSTPVWAGPEGGVVVGGTGTIEQSDLNTIITQNTDRLAIDWNSFDVNVDERVTFIQPTDSSVALNRILSGNTSNILGQIDANGHVVLMNPNGILFGKDASINVGGLVASGLAIDPNDFMNGDFALSAIEGSDGAIVNAGIINASTGGNVVLIGQSVDNKGLISAKLGSVTLAAGKEAIVSFDNQGLLGVKVTQAMLQSELGLGAAVQNNGEIQAEGGRVLLTSSTSQDIFTQAVNAGDLHAKTSVVMHDDGSFTLGGGADVVNTGAIDVSSAEGVAEGVAGRVVVLGENITNEGSIVADALGTDSEAIAGSIELHSTDTTLLTKSSQISASAKLNGSGGDVKVLGNKVGLIDQADVSAKGANGGGSILVGGDQEGGNPLVRNAEFIYLGEDTGVDVSATVNGDGGTIITFAEDTARIHGQLAARGGSQGGNGGFIETSGVVALEITDTPDISAPVSQAGKWLIDPGNITIVQDASGPGIEEFVADELGGLFTSDLDSSVIGVDTLNAALDAGAEITVQTSTAGNNTGLITVNADVNLSSNVASTLNLVADGGINVNNNITASAGSLTLNFQAGGEILLNGGSNVALATGGGDATFNAAEITLSSGTTISTSGGKVEILTLGGNTTNGIYGDIQTGGGDFTANFNGYYNVQQTGGSILTQGGDLDILVSAQDFNAMNAIYDTTGGTGQGDILLRATAGSLTMPTISAKGNITIEANQGDIVLPYGNLSGNGWLQMSTNNGGILYRNPLAVANAGRYLIDVVGDMTLNSQSATLSFMGSQAGDTIADLNVGGTLDITTSGSDSKFDGSGIDAYAIDFTESAVNVSGDAALTAIGGAIISNANSSIIANNLTLTSSETFDFGSAITSRGTTSITTTAGDITYSGSLLDVGTNLELSAGSDIFIDADLTLSNANFIAKDTGSVELAAGTTLSTGGGSVNVTGFSFLANDAFVDTQTGSTQGQGHVTIDTAFNTALPSFNVDGNIEVNANTSLALPTGDVDVSGYISYSAPNIAFSVSTPGFYQTTAGNNININGGFVEPSRPTQSITTSYTAGNNIDISSNSDITLETSLTAENISITSTAVDSSINFDSGLLNAGTLLNLDAALDININADIALNNADFIATAGGGISTQSIDTSGGLIELNAGGRTSTGDILTQGGDIAISTTGEFFALGRTYGLTSNRTGAVKIDADSVHLPRQIYVNGSLDAVSQNHIIVEPGTIDATDNITLSAENGTLGQQFNGGSGVIKSASDITLNADSFAFFDGVSAVSGGDLNVTSQETFDIPEAASEGLVSGGVTTITSTGGGINFNSGILNAGTTLNLDAALDININADIALDNADFIATAGNSITLANITANNLTLSASSDISQTLDTELNISGNTHIEGTGTDLAAVLGNANNLTTLSLDLQHSGGFVDVTNASALTVNDINTNFVSVDIFAPEIIVDGDVNTPAGINFFGDNNANTFTVTANANFLDNAAGSAFHLDGGDDIINISSDVLIDILGGDGNDTFNILEDNLTLGSIDGGADNDLLSMASVSGDYVWRLGQANRDRITDVASFSDVESVLGGQGQDSFVISGQTGVTSIDGGDAGGSNSIGANIGTSVSLQEDGLNPSGIVFNLNDSTISYTETEDTINSLVFANVSNFSTGLFDPDDFYGGHLITGNDDNKWVLTRNTGTFDTNVIELIPSSGSSLFFQGITTLEAGTGTDTLDASQLTNDFTWTVDGDSSGFTNDGRTNRDIDSFNFSGFESLIGSSANDTFEVSANIGNISGGAGTNRIETNLAEDQIWQLNTNDGSITSTTLDINFDDIQQVYAQGIGNNVSFYLNDLASNVVSIGSELTTLSTLSFANLGQPIVLDLNNIGREVIGIDTFEGNGLGSTLIGDNANRSWGYDNTDGSLVTGSGGQGIVFTDFESFTAGTGVDTLVSLGDSSSWDITGTNSGILNGTFAFSGVEIAEGSIGNDTFTFSDNASINQVLGNDGDDTFVFANNVSVNLLNGGDGNDILDIGNLNSIIDYLGVVSVGEVNLNTANIEETISSGGTGSLTLFGGDAGSSWLINADGTININVAGVDYSFDQASGISAVLGGTGDDSFVLAEGASLSNGISGGSNANDSLTALGTSDIQWTINAQDTGTLTSNGITTSFSEIATLIGSDGNDSFEVVAEGSLTGAIDGGLGADQLISTDITRNSWFIGQSQVLDVLGDIDNPIAQFSQIEDIVATGDTINVGSSTTDVTNINGGTSFEEIPYSFVSSLTSLMVDLRDSSLNYYLDNDTLSTVINFSNIGGFRSSATPGVNQSIFIAEDTDNDWTIFDLGDSELPGGKVTSVNGSVDFFGFSIHQGGSAVDTISTYDSTSAINWNVDTSSNITIVADENTYNFTNIENLIGSDSDDTFNISAQIDSISGGGGTNLINASIAENQDWQLNANDGTLSSDSLFVQFDGIQQVNADGLEVRYYLNDLSSNVTDISATINTDATVSFDNLAQPAVLDLGDTSRQFIRIDAFEGNGASNQLIGTNTDNQWTYLSGDGSLELSIDNLPVNFSDFDTLIAGSGSDTLTVSGATENFWSLSGANNGILNSGFNFTGIDIIEGGVGNDTFTFTDNTSIDQVLGNDGDDTFIMANNVAVNLLDGGAGNDTLDIGSLNSIMDYLGVVSIGDVNLNTANIEQTLSGDGSGSLTLFGGDTGSDWLINSDGSISITVAGVDYSFDQSSGISSVLGGAGDDNFVLAEGASLTSGIVGGSADNDSITLQGTDDIQWSIDKADGGSLTSNGVTTSFNQIATLVSGGGDDSFEILAGGSVSGAIDGGLGSDTLIANNGIANSWYLGEDGVNGLDRLGQTDVLALFKGFETVVASTFPNTDGSVNVFELGSATTSVENIRGSAPLNGFSQVIYASTGMELDLDSSQLSYYLDNGELSNSIAYSDINFFGTANSQDAPSTVQAPNQTNSWYFDDSVGTDEFQVYLDSGDTTVLLRGFGLVQGGADVDTITGRSNIDGVTWNINAANSGSVTYGDKLFNFTNIENLIGSDSDDTFNIYSPDVQNIDGGAGNNTLAGGDQDNSWDITEDNGGLFNDTNFTNIQNLVGGSGIDLVYVFESMSIGDIQTGAGDDYVTLDQNASGQSIIMGDDSDTVLLLNAASVSGLLDGGAGDDTLDLGAYGAAIELDFLSGTSSSGIIGENFEIEILPEDGASIFGGDLNTDWNFLDGGGIEIIAYNDDGSIFKTDTVNSAYSLIRSGTGTNKFTLANLENYDTTIQANASATNTLTGSDLINNWIIDGLNTGQVQDSNSGDTTIFQNIANIIGGDGSDLFILENGGSITGSIQGGLGTDSLAIADDTATNSWVLAAQNSVGLVNQFSGIELLVGNVNADNFTFNGVSDVVEIDGALGNNVINWNNSDVLVNLNDSSINSGAITFGGISEFNADAAEANTLQGNNEDSAWVLNSVDSGSITNSTTTQFSGFNQLLGGTGNNTLNGTDDVSIWTLNGQDQGSLEVNAVQSQFANMQQLIGGAGNDTFILAELNADISNGIIGGAGVNSLNGFSQRKNTWVVDGIYQGSVNGGMNFSQINTLQGGDLGDLFEVTASSMIDDIDGGSGDDHFDIGTDAITGTLSGDAGDDRFDIGDRATIALIDGGAHTIEDILDLSEMDGAVVIDFLGNQNTGIASVDVENIILNPDDVSFDGGDGSNRWQIDGDGSGTLTKLDGQYAGDYRFSNASNLIGGDGDDQFILSAAGNISGYLDGGEASNSLAAKDMINNWIIDGANQGSLAGNDGSGTLFRNIGQLIGADSAADTFTIAAGGDVSQIDAGSQSVGNRLIVDQSLAANWTIGNGSDQFSIANQTVAFAGINIIDASSGDDRFTLTGTQSSVISVNAGLGDNSIEGFDQDNTWQINADGSTTLNDQLSVSGFNSFTGGNAADTFTVADNTALKDIYGGDGNDSFNIGADVSVDNLFGEAGDDSFVIAPTLSVSGVIDGGTAGETNGDTIDLRQYRVNSATFDISALVGFSFSNFANILEPLNDGTYFGGDGTNIWTITGENEGRLEVIDGTNAGTYSFNGIHTLLGGSGTDTFIFETDQAAITTEIVGGSGSDNTLDLSAQNLVNQWLIDGLNNGSVSNSANSSGNIFSNIATIIGGSNIDTLQSDTSGDSTWRIAGIDQGVLEIANNSANFSGMENLVGGLGNDTFTFAAASQISGSIDGSDGIDSLSYQGNNNQWLVDTESNAVTGTLLDGDTDASLSFIRLETLQADGNNDQLIASNSGNNTWVVGDSINNTYLNLEASTNLQVAFSGMEQLLGGSGNDDFTLVDAAALPTFIDGALGNDSVDTQGVNQDLNITLDDIGEGSAALSLQLANINVLTANANRAHQIIGASDQGYTWIIDNLSSGIVNPSIDDGSDQNLRFNNVSAVIGGANDDIFQVLNTTAISLDGGDALNADFVDYSQVNANISINLADSLNGSSGVITGIEGLRGNNSGIESINTAELVGSNTNNVWTIADFDGEGVADGVNDGQFSNGSETISFIDFNVLTGGSNTDTFNQSNGVIEGRIMGGAGNDSLSITLGTDASNTLNNRGTQFVGGGDNDTLVIRGGSRDLQSLYTATATGGEFIYRQFDTDYRVAHEDVEVINELSTGSALELRGSSASDRLALADGAFSFNQLPSVNHNKGNLVIRTDASDRVEIVDNILLAGSLTLVNGSLTTNDTDSTSITANELVLENTQAIGSISNRIRTSVDNLVVDNALGDIYLQEENGLNIADFTPAADFDVVLLRGDLTSANVLESDSRFSAMTEDGNITLNNQNRLAGDVVLKASDTVTFNSEITVTLAGVDAETLILQSDESILQNAPVTVSDYTYLDAGRDIVLDNTQNDFNRISISAGNDVTIVDQNELQLFGVDVGGHLKVKSAGLNIDNQVTANTLELDGGTGSVVMTNQSTVVVTGQADVKAEADIVLSSVTAKEVVLETTQGSLVDGNDDGENVKAEKLTVKASEGVGANDALETEVKTVNVNTATGNVDIKNEGEASIEKLATEDGNVNLNNNGTVSLQPDSVKAAGEGSNKGGVSIGASTGDIKQTDNTGVPAIVATKVDVEAPNGSFGQGGINIDAGQVTVKAQRQLGQLITPPGTTRDAQFSGTFKFEDQLLVVEQFEDISPAVFSNVKGYFYNDISLKLSADQLYDDEDEDEE